jgi:hypothetical protein
MMGEEWLQSMGVLDVVREIEAPDTLEYRGRLEETWRVAEAILDGSNLLSRGRFWYGVSGLLKGDQTWEVESRGSDGAAGPVMQFRRELVRL